MTYMHFQLLNDFESFYVFRVVWIFGELGQLEQAPR